MLLEFCSRWAPVVSGRDDNSQPGLVVGRSHSRCSQMQATLSIDVWTSLEVLYDS